MKKVKFLTISIFAIALFASCSDDDVPETVLPQEVITTLRLTLEPIGGGTDIVLEYLDLDADGPNPPVVIVSGNLAAGTSYNGTILLLNETVNPPENVTEEVDEENLEHQFFYTIGGDLNVTTEYENFDTDGNPLGTELMLSTGEASSGTLTLTLRHEPNKPNSGLADAGGETDIEVTFDVAVVD
jgi:hypothetical protein